MDWDHVETRWPDVQESLKAQWKHLTDDDIQVIKGRRPQLEELLMKYYGYDDQKARSEVDNWLKQF